MRKVFETISDVVLPAVVFLAVLAILLGSSLLGRVGARMEEPGEDFSQMGDSYAVQAFSERKLPEIRCIGKKLWDVGEVLSVSQTFSGIDTEGNSLEVTVLDITDQDGVSVIGCFSKESGQAVFASRGVYTFLLAAVDGQRQRSVGRISVLVDGR